jgi:hypothetical protein
MFLPKNISKFFSIKNLSVLDDTTSLYGLMSNIFTSKSYFKSQGMVNFLEAPEIICLLLNITILIIKISKFLSLILFLWITRIMLSVSLWNILNIDIVSEIINKLDPYINREYLYNFLNVYLFLPILGSAITIVEETPEIIKISESINNKIQETKESLFSAARKAGIETNYNDTLESPDVPETNSSIEPETLETEREVNWWAIAGFIIFLSVGGIAIYYYYKGGGDLPDSDSISKSSSELKNKISNNTGNLVNKLKGSVTSLKETISSNRDVVDSLSTSSGHSTPRSIPTVVTSPEVLSQFIPLKNGGMIHEAMLPSMEGYSANRSFAHFADWLNAAHKGTELSKPVVLNLYREAEFLHKYLWKIGPNLFSPEQLESISADLGRMAVELRRFDPITNTAAFDNKFFQFDWKEFGDNCYRAQIIAAKANAAQ